MKKKNQIQAFISYSHKDKNFTSFLDKWMKENGIDTFLDTRDIKVGDLIPEKIAHGIKSSKYLIYVVSSNSIKSNWVKEELNIAKVKEKEDKGFKILPIVIDDIELPDSIKHVKCADAKDWKNKKKALEALINVMEAMGIKPITKIAVEDAISIKTKSNFPLWLLGTILLIIATYFISRLFWKPIAPDVIVYSAMDKETHDMMTEAFKKKFGLDVHFSLIGEGSAVEIAKRIRTEAKHKIIADVFLGGSAEIHEGLARDKLLEEYKGKKNASSNQEYSSKTWKGCWINPLVFGYNEKHFPTDLLQKEVFTRDILLEPGLKGEIRLCNPASVGGGVVFWFAQIFRFEKFEDTVGFMRKLHENDVKYEDMSVNVVNAVGEGYAMIGVTWFDDFLRLKEKFPNKNFKTKIPDDTGYEIGAVSIIKGCPNLSNAKKFIDFMLGKEAARINARQSRVPLYKLEQVEMPDHLHNQSTITKKGSKYDVKIALENYKKWQELWFDGIKTRWSDTKKNQEKIEGKTNQ